MALTGDRVGEKGSVKSHTLQLLGACVPQPAICKVVATGFPRISPFASVLEAHAGVEKARTNLDFCTKVHAAADICDGVGAGVRGPGTTNTHSPASHADTSGQGRQPLWVH